MSFRVLVIPEDPQQNGYILKPLLECVLEAAGKPRAKVKVLTNPRIQGYAQAVETIRGNLVERYSFYNAWVFVPDADRASPAAMEHLETDLRKRGVTLLCCPAEPEVEIYACIAYREQLGNWSEARRHPRFKEHLFAPLLEEHGDPRAAGAGRVRMIENSLANPDLVFSLCDELERLRVRLSTLTET